MFPSWSLCFSVLCFPDYLLQNAGHLSSYFKALDWCTLSLGSPLFLQFICEWERSLLHSGLRSELGVTRGGLQLWIKSLTPPPLPKLCSYICHVLWLWAVFSKIWARRVAMSVVFCILYEAFLDFKGKTGAVWTLTAPDSSEEQSIQTFVHIFQDLPMVLFLWPNQGCVYSFKNYVISS